MNGFFLSFEDVVYVDIFAVTNVDFLSYNVATLFGLVPGIFLYCIVAQQASNAASSAKDDATGGGSTATSIVAGTISFLAVVAVSIYAKRIIDVEMKKAAASSATVGGGTNGGVSKK